MLAALTHSSAALLLPLPNLAQRKAAVATVHIKISGKWYDATAWADKHPGGRYVLEWADGYDVTNAFHTIHLFSSKKASDMLARMPEADLSTRTRRELVLPPIERVPMEAQAPTGMDRFMAAGEKVVELLSPPAATLPDRVPVRPASGLAWQPQHSAEGAEGAKGAGRAEGAVGTEGAVGESALKRELEDLLHRHFASPAEYKATTEHWLRIGAALMLWATCLAGWVAGSLPATLALPFAQWLLFSPTVHESSHSTLSTTPWVNKAAAFCGLPFIYNPYIWWPQHILSHHQYTNDDALDVDLHHLRPARLHPGCEVREMQGDRRYGMGRSGWVRGCMVGLMARCHDACAGRRGLRRCQLHLQGLLQHDGHVRPLASARAAAPLHRPLVRQPRDR